MMGDVYLGGNFRGYKVGFGQLVLPKTIALNHYAELRVIFT